MVEEKKQGYAVALTAEERGKKFRETLWRLVVQSGRSERQICQQLGHNSGYINKLLNGNADPSYIGLLELADYFKVEIGVMFGEK